MPSLLGLTFRFLDPAFHGRRDGNEPEWPPSPLRAFQALVAAAAARGRRGGMSRTVRTALGWLESQPPPTVVAPIAVTGVGRCHSVPNNAMDVVASAWSRGNDSNVGDANPAKHRTMKTVRSTYLRERDAVRYLWSLAEDPHPESLSHAAILCDVASSVVALGWGIDMVVGHGAIVTQEQADAIPGERWHPKGNTGGNQLRSPKKGTLVALDHRHEGFINRLGKDGFKPPPPFTAYSTVSYRRDADASPLPFAAFSLLKLDASGLRAFDTARRALTVAGMARHATRRAAEDAGWDEGKVRAFVLGHGEAKNGSRHVAPGAKRFAYLPLPSIESRGDGGNVLGMVRRVLLCAPAEGCDGEVTWARRSLSGRELVDEQGEFAALLSLVPGDDRMVRRYTRPAATWATVTPVVLPGHDDPGKYRRRLKRASDAKEQRELLGYLDNRVDALLRRAILHSGYGKILAEHAELEWSKVGFWPGTDLAARYGAPDHLRRFPRLHVKLTWRDAQGIPIGVPGPVCIGAGRFLGLGLFAAMG